jgi:hypothetical protein
MARKGKSTEEIIAFLREAVAQRETAGKIYRRAGISEQTYCKGGAGTAA